MQILRTVAMEKNEIRKGTNFSADPLCSMRKLITWSLRSVWNWLRCRSSKMRPLSDSDVVRANPRMMWYSLGFSSWKYAFFCSICCMNRICPVEKKRDSKHFFIYLCPTFENLSYMLLYCGLKSLSRQEKTQRGRLFGVGRPRSRNERAFRRKYCDIVLLQIRYNLMDDSCLLIMTVRKQPQRLVAVTARSICYTDSYSVKLAAQERIVL